MGTLKHSLSASLSKCSLSSYSSLLKRSHERPQARSPDGGWRPHVSCGPAGHNDTCYLVSQRSREATSEFRQTWEGCSHPRPRAVEQRPLPAWGAQGPSLLGCPSRPPALASSLVPLSLIVRVCSQRSWSILPTARGGGEEPARCRESARPQEREGHRDLWLWGRRRPNRHGPRAAVLESSGHSQRCVRKEAGLLRKPKPGLLGFTYWLQVHLLCDLEPLNLSEPHRALL